MDRRLSQYDMIIQHRPGKQHGNADGLSRIPDDYCNCYEAGINVSSLPCRGCKFCTNVHNQWAQFLEEVDDVIPLAVRTASLDISPEDILSSEFSIDEESTCYLVTHLLNCVKPNKLILNSSRCSPGWRIR